jgi:hypothetical protein
MWGDEYSVNVISFKEYIDRLPFPYDASIGKFFWGPGEYPKKVDGGYMKWTDDVAPLYADG